MKAWASCRKLFVCCAWGRESQQKKKDVEKKTDTKIDRKFEEMVCTPSAAGGQSQHTHKHRASGWPSRQATRVF